MLSRLRRIKKYLLYNDIMRRICFFKRFYRKMRLVCSAALCQLKAYIVYNYYDITQPDFYQHTLHSPAVCLFLTSLANSFQWPRDFSVSFKWTVYVFHVTSIVIVLQLKLLSSENWTKKHKWLWTNFHI